MVDNAMARVAGGAPEAEKRPSVRENACERYRLYKRSSE